jgi:tetratricopeptide (TPR) repeat protein
MVASLTMGTITIILTPGPLAILLNNMAFQIYADGHLQTALRVYDLALLIKPNNPEALYSQGKIYQDLQDVNNAYYHYEAAKDQKLPSAYSQLARLYILDKKYYRAVMILSEGLELTLTDRERYAILKNLGWARLELARQGKVTYEQAEIPLRQAIALEDESGSPHCLLAQVLESKAVKSESLVEWRKCLDFGNSNHPDERNWIKDARQRLGM